MQIHEWMSSTRAADIMVRQVITFEPSCLLARAAGVLLQEQISGAPIVEESRGCLGVLSVSDVLTAGGKVVEEQQQIAQSTFWNSNLMLPTSVYEDKLAQVRDKLVPAAEQPVERFMTTDLVGVNEETPLETIVQKMVDAHVHRVLVLGENQCLQGIISTTDVLAALLRVTSEALAG